jgi:II/X family phage/plasmid replication protein
VIDWLTLRVVSSYEVRAGHVQSITADGEIEWRTEKRMPVEGSHSSQVTLRRSASDGWLEISGNPSKFLQGHNLFGSDDLHALVPSYVLAVFDRIGYRPTADEIENLEAGIVTLSRIDINRNSDFGSRPRALAAIRALSECSYLAYRGRGSLVAEGTCLWGKGSRRWNMKAYAKGLELKAHPIPTSVPHADQLHAYADGLVRMEVTIRAMELKQRGLDVVTKWAILGVSPRSVFDDLVGRLNIAEATMKEPTGIQAELTPKLRSIFQLWYDGHDLREIFPARMTFYRHRKALLPYGVDIAVKRPRDVSNVVPLVVTLVGREVGVPDWAKGTSLYFDPPRRAA